MGYEAQHIIKCTTHVTSGGASGTISSSGIGGVEGNSIFSKSGSSDIPCNMETQQWSWYIRECCVMYVRTGQMSSFGVPRTLRTQHSWSISFSPYYTECSSAHRWMGAPHHTTHRYREGKINNTNTITVKKV